MGIDLGEGDQFGLDAEQFQNLKMGDTVLYQKTENDIVSRAIAEVVLPAGDDEKCLIIIRSDYYVIKGKENLEIGKEFRADKSELKIFE